MDSDKEIKFLRLSSLLQRCADSLEQLHIEDLEHEEKTKAEKRTGKPERKFAIPDELFEKVQELAAEYHVPVLDIFRYFIKQGLLIADLKTSEEIISRRPGEPDERIRFIVV